MTRTSAPTRLRVGGAPEGFDALLIAEEVARAGGPVIHVARDDARVAALRAALAFLAPGLPVLGFPAWDCLPYDRVSPRAEVSAARMATLAALAGGWDRPAVILTTVAGATQRVPPREVVAGASFTARVGQRIDVGALRAFLARMGFVQSSTVMEPGDYAIRGGLIDIYPPGDTGPIRLDLFGDVLDAARRFEAESQRTVEKVAEVALAPVSEVILDEPAIERFRTRYRTEFGAAGRDDPLYEAVSTGAKHAGYEHWVPFFHERLETLFDYLPGAPVSLDDQADPARDARWEQVQEHYAARREALGQGGAMGVPYKPVAPGLLYLDDAGWDAATEGRRVLSLTALPQPSGPGVIDAGGRIGRSFAPERQAEDGRLFAALADHIAAARRKGRAIVASYSEGARDRMATMLADQGVEGAVPVARLDDLPDVPGALGLAVWPLEAGFEARGTTVIAEQDILGERLIRAPKKRKRAEDVLTEAAALTTGDLVVHVAHGIGRFQGLETVEAMGAPHECLHLEYAGGDKLYLPVENIELLTRYGHEDGLLDRLGGGAWQARKARMKERIRDMAERLIRVA
ncbi:MAG: CarD family transcriptional regulator, partial [Pseudomonadota bacterium]